MPETAPVALVTGAARRVGAVIARRLHAAGYDLVLHHRRSAESASALQVELERERPGSTLVLQAELSEFDRLPELIAHTIGRYGRLDALVNNASAFYPTPIGTTVPAQWDELFASNARAPFFLSQAAVPHLRKARGAIVNLADVYAERPLAGHTVYCMAKAALAMLTLSLAKELGPEIRVNAVAPGAVLWPEEGRTPAEREAMIAGTALQRTGTPEEVAEAVRWLLQDAHYTTGQILRVDGGRFLRI
ncbi:pteridine reductase [Arenimonas sp.]|uniref:pteridine reductase n=1 Tax=Arenimonas sp. TaxID=1872635 RepID=UPI0039E46E69